MIDTLSAGENIKCTINKMPANKASCETITRLMRRDPDIKRNLARAQRMRRQRMNSYIRGGRLWYAREKAARIALRTQQPRQDIAVAAIVAGPGQHQHPARIGPVPAWPARCISNAGGQS